MPSFHVRLILSDQRPLAGAAVRLVVWSLDGLGEPLVEGETDGEGKLELAAEFPEGLTLLPRIAVQLLVDGDWRDLGDSPTEVSRELIEFGTLIVGDEPVEPTRDPAELEKDLLDSLAQNKLLGAKLSELDSQLVKAKLELEKAQASLADYPQPSPLVDVVKDLGSQLGTAAKTLDQAALGMVLGDVSISLKGVSSGAGAFEFPTISQLREIAGVEMSTIDLTFHSIKPVLGTTIPAPDKGSGIPNLLGYTELLARRKLEALQLGVEVSHKALAKPDTGPSPWGRVVEQSPAPGAAIVPGTRVEILIGKPIEGDKPTDGGAKKG